MTVRTKQVGETETIAPAVESFAKTLSRRELTLTRVETKTLQINLGLRCNQACRHCHLEAGPKRTEEMDEGTVRLAAAYAERGGFQVVDITGGAPELNPNLPLLLDLVREKIPRVMLRANLTALLEEKQGDLLAGLPRGKVVIVASFPALNASQADAQRGARTFERSLVALKKLNQLGYGQKDSGLELNLVSNPAGAFLPPGQAGAETRFRRQLAEKWGICFNQLFTFANVPLGRFRRWLEASGNYQAYMKRLAESFNPCALEGVMCRSQVSMAWDGRLYDCDFNLAANLPLGGRGTLAKDLEKAPEPGTPIAVGDHCYTCTAGAGFT